MKNFDTYKDFATKVANIVKEDGLNVLFNNAGYSTKFSRLNYVKHDQLLDAYIANTVGPIMLTKVSKP